jgi:hypothetical protein
MNIARQVMGAMGGKPIEKVDYVMNGKLNGSLFSTVRFKSAGTLDLPRTCRGPPTPRERRVNDLRDPARHVPPRASQRVIRRTEIQGSLWMLKPSVS